MTIAKRFLKVDVEKEISQEVDEVSAHRSVCTGFSTRHVC